MSLKTLIHLLDSFPPDNIIKFYCKQDHKHYDFYIYGLNQKQEFELRLYEEGLVKYPLKVQTLKSILYNYKDYTLIIRSEKSNYLIV